MQGTEQALFSLDVPAGVPIRHVIQYSMAVVVV